MPPCGGGFSIPITINHPDCGAGTVGTDDHPRRDEERKLLSPPPVLGRWSGGVIFSTGGTPPDGHGVESRRPAVADQILESPPRPRNRRAARFLETEKLQTGAAAPTQTMVWSYSIPIGFRRFPLHFSDFSESRWSGGTWDDLGTSNRRV